MDALSAGNKCINSVTQEGSKNSSQITAEKQDDLQQSLDSSSPSKSDADLPSFKCTECSYQSIWKHAVKRHQRIHFKDEDGIKIEQFQCNHCSFSVDDMEEFREHQTLHITSNQTSTTTSKRTRPVSTNKFKCKICLMQFRYEKCYKNHLKVHKSKGEVKIFKCDQCNFNSVKNRVFVKHIRLCHEKGGGLVKDKPEGKSSEEISIKSKASSSANGKRAYQRGKYANVPIKMTKDGLFQCEHCSYQTAIRTALFKHQTNHEKSPNL